MCRTTVLHCPACNEDYGITHQGCFTGYCGVFEIEKIYKRCRDIHYPWDKARELIGLLAKYSDESDGDYRGDVGDDDTDNEDTPSPKKRKISGTHSASIKRKGRKTRRLPSDTEQKIVEIYNQVVQETGSDTGLVEGLIREMGKKEGKILAASVRAAAEMVNPDTKEEKTSWMEQVNLGELLAIVSKFGSLGRQRRAKILTGPENVIIIKSQHPLNIWPDAKIQARRIKRKRAQRTRPTPTPTIVRVLGACVNIAAAVSLAYSITALQRDYKVLDDIPGSWNRFNKYCRELMAEYYTRTLGLGQIIKLESAARYPDIVKKFAEFPEWAEEMVKARRLRLVTYSGVPPQRVQAQSNAVDSLFYKIISFILPRAPIYEANNDMQADQGNPKGPLGSKSHENLLNPTLTATTSGLVNDPHFFNTLHATGAGPGTIQSRRTRTTGTQRQSSGSSGSQQPRNPAPGRLIFDE